MNKSLNHLPRYKKEEIQAIEKQIRSEGLRIDKIILFGSYARGTYVEDEGIAEDGSRYDYVSDYDLLVVLERSREVYRFDCWKKVEKRLEAFENSPPINIIKHTFDEVNYHLSVGHYFFTEIINEGVLLYDRHEVPFDEVKQLTNDELLEVKQGYFDHWMERALMFLKTYTFLMQSGDMKLAAFTLHQATESLFGCLLLVKTGYKPRSHDIQSLERKIAQQVEEFQEVFPKETKEQQDLFEFLNHAYIDSRYKKGFKISKEALVWLEKPVFKLKEVVNQLCKDEGVVIEILDKAPSDENREEFMAELEKSWEDSDRKNLALKTIQNYRDEGFQLGEQKGRAEGKEEGYQLGEQAGLKKGRKIGEQKGYKRGEQKGLERGLERGKKEEAFKIAKSLKEKGMDSQFIAETTGLSMETIEGL